jgi:F-type H+-transporting ATPase subunit epsilon
VSNIQCHIVSAEEELFVGEVKFIVASAAEGDVGISNNHAPLLTSLQPGPIKLTFENDEEEHFYVSGGFIEIQPGKVTILADSALRANDMDEAAALEAKKSALQDIENRHGDADYSVAAAKLAEAAAQLRTLQQIRKKYK